MTWETAQAAVDWLHSVGCRVLAFMGGEVLLRKDFVLRVSRYASERGFYIYLPTNGVFLDEAFIDAAGDAGVDLFNLAVDCVDPIPGLPKALSRIEDQYRLLLEKSRERDFLVMFNINITPHNADDVEKLTEIAHRDRINCDYHIFEKPQKEMPHFKTDDGRMEFRPESHERLVALFDWLLGKYDEGYNIANPREYFVDGKRFIRDEPLEWKCLAGKNTIVIQTDGRLAPCFEFFNDERDWGTIGNPKFDVERLEEMKRTCVPRCLSTCNRGTSYYYRFMPSLEWVGKYFRTRA
jgi:MoaA/NifB/PqqE/SkfB family radical SAM enzyme